MIDPLHLDSGGHRTWIKWHRARRRAGDPAFTRSRILEGMRLGASVEIDLANYTLGTNLENLSLNDGGLNGTGNGRDNIFFGNNLGNFLAYWDQRKSNLSINAPAGRGGAVTITTVHKAKGLAYGVVIVPWADWSLEPSSAFGGSYLWGRLEADDKPGVVVLAYEDDPADDENHRRSEDNMRRLELAGAGVPVVPTVPRG